MKKILLLLCIIITPFLFSCDAGSDSDDDFGEQSDFRAVESIRFKMNEIHLEIGESDSLSKYSDFEILPSHAEESVSLSVGDNEFIAIDDMKITGLAVGETTLKVASVPYPSVYDEVSLFVHNKTELAGVPVFSDDSIFSGSVFLTVTETGSSSNTDSVSISSNTDGFKVTADVLRDSESIDVLAFITHEGAPYIGEITSFPIEKYKLNTLSDLEISSVSSIEVTVPTGFGTSFTYTGSGPRIYLAYTYELAFGRKIVFITEPGTHQITINDFFGGTYSVSDQVVQRGETVSVSVE